MSSRHARRPAHPPRDQRESAFASILRELVLRVPGARAAALVDFQGETVDYWGRAAPFDLRVAAAHWRIVLDEAHGQRSLQGLKWFAARAARRSYLVIALPERYALVIVLLRAAGFAGWQRAVATCARSLGEEAAWGREDAAPPLWFPVEIVSDVNFRPRSIRIAQDLFPLEILGTIVRRAPSGAWVDPGDFSGRERGWRVRFESGAESTLIREPGGLWYADAPVEGTIPRRNPEQRTPKQNR